MQNHELKVYDEIDELPNAIIENSVIRENFVPVRANARRGLRPLLTPKAPALATGKSPSWT